MSWIDEPGAGERSEEWDSMVGDLVSTIESLTEQFGENETAGVIRCAGFLTEEVTRLHEASGSLHLPTPPVIDVAGEADLVGRWAEDSVDEDDDDWADPRREVRVTFGAVGSAAIGSARRLENALSRLAGEFEAVGGSSTGALVELADAAAWLAEWSYIYVEAALGYCEVLDCLPDSAPGCGSLEDMYQWENVEQLRADLRSSLAGAPSL